MTVYDDMRPFADIRCRHSGKQTARFAAWLWRITTASALSSNAIRHRRRVNVGPAFGLGGGRLELDPTKQLGIEGNDDGGLAIAVVVYFAAGMQA